MTESASVDQATGVATAYSQLSELVNRHWRNLRVGAISVAALVVIAIAVTVFLTRPLPDSKPIAALERNASRIDQLSNALQANCAAERSDASCEKTRVLLSSLANDQRSIVDYLKNNTPQAGQEASSLLQLIGGTAILAILGYLGLMRLQGLDQELSALRQYVFDQIKIRVEETRAVIRSNVVEDIRDENEKLAEEVRFSSKRATTELNEIVSSSRGEADRLRVSLEAISTRIETVLSEYPWLRSEELRDSLAQLGNVKSASKAHELASDLSDSDVQAALTVLQAVVNDQLPGSRDAFHNCHVQAMKLMAPKLGLEIANAGLKLFPGDVDLIGDKASVLIELGRAEEAVRLVSEWRAEKPLQFARSWRPIIFFASAARALEMTAELKEEVISSFEGFLAVAPHTDNVWSGYGDFLADCGDQDGAEAIFRRGITYNPYSQVLHYSLGRLLLEKSRPEEAASFLENAVKYDIQTDFQPDVSPLAVIGMLAQALDASGQISRAQILYRFLARGPRHIGAYAQSRLMVLSLIDDSAQDGSDPDVRELLEILQSQAQRNAQPEPT